MERDIKYIFIHCTGGNQLAMPLDLMKGFAQKGWKTPGYHIVVDFMGRPHLMLSFDRVANGVKGWNQNSIHLAWIGGADGKDSRTQEQVDTLRLLVKLLRGMYPEAKIMGHRDIWGEDPKNWQKTCPNFDVKEELETYTKKTHP